MPPSLYMGMTQASLSQGMILFKQGLAEEFSPYILVARLPWISSLASRTRSSVHFAVRSRSPPMYLTRVPCS